MKRILPILISVLAINLTANAQEAVSWTNTAGVSTSGSTLTKTAADGWGTAGGESTQKLIASTNGYIQWTVSTVAQGEFFVGLSMSNPDNNFYTIAYAFHRTNTTLTYVRTSGTSVLSFFVAANDVLRIERSGTSMLFKQNGTTIYTASSVSTSQMLVDAALYTNGSVIAGVQVSFPPSAPTGLSATTASSSQINLAWTDASSTESGFEVERSTTSGSGFSLINTTAANATSYNDTGLAAGTTYYYRIRSKNTSTSSPNTSEASATTTSGVSAPTSPAATSLTATTVKIDWTDASSNETGFQVERSTTSGGTYSLVATAAANAVTYTDTGLTPSTQYYYRVRAVNSTDQSAYTSVVNATTGAVPAAPTSLSATIASPSSINLAWTDASSNETGFEIERSTTSGSGFSLINTTAANATSFTDTGLSPSTTYYYKIRSISGGASSSYTSESSATTGGGVTAPSGLTATTQTEARILLGWTDNSSDETGFEVERATTSGGPFTAVTTKAANSVSYLDASASPATQYYYRVRAVKSTGPVYSTYTSVATATTLTTPASPSSLTATPTSSTAIDLHWTDNSTNETLFLIERSTTTGSGFTALPTTAPADATSYTDDSLMPGTTYYYRVSAMGQELYSLPSSEAHATTGPAAPGNLAALLGTSAINLTWTDNATNETNYAIERSTTTGTGYSVLSTQPANSTSYSDATVLLGTRYFYRVRALGSVINSGYSGEVSETLTSTFTQLCTGLYCDGLGGVSVGSSSVPSGYRFAVKGKMIAEGLKLDLQMAWPDYVFANNYSLRDLPSLGTFINQNKHLPGMPTEAEVTKDGIDVGEMNVKLLEKIEELSLYVIQIEERLRKYEEAEGKMVKSQENK